MLLLVVQSQLDQVTPAGILACVEQGLQGGIHLLAPGCHLGHGRSAQEASLRPGLAGAHRFVIGIEEIGPARIRAAMARMKGLEHEGFEEPGGVGQMPFGGAGIGHALQAEVLRL